MSKDWTIGSDGWVDGSIFGFKVEHQEVPRPSNQAYLHLDATSKLGNLHTSEGSGMDSLIATLRAKQFAGQWCVGLNRVVQTRPVWAQGSLLLGGDSTNKPMRMEVEQVAFSKFSGVWTPVNSTLDPMAALVAFYNIEYGVPLKVPIASWKDDGSDISPGFFGANNRRSQAASAGLGNLEGWIHHCEVPQNLHADCGTYNRTLLFAKAKVLIDSVNPPPNPPPGGDDMTESEVQELLESQLGIATNSQLIRMAFLRGADDHERGRPRTYLAPGSPGYNDWLRGWDFAAKISP